MIILLLVITLLCTAWKKGKPTPFARTLMNCGQNVKDSERYYQASIAKQSQHCYRMEKTIIYLTYILVLK